MDRIMLETMLSAMKDQESRRFLLNVERPNIQWEVTRKQDTWILEKLDGSTPYEKVASSVEKISTQLTFENGYGGVKPLNYKLVDAAKELTTGVPTESLSAELWNRQISSAEVISKNGMQTLSVTFAQEYPFDMSKMTFQDARNARVAYENKLPDGQRWGSMDFKPVPHLTKETRNQMLDQAANGITKVLKQELVR